jgi:hypothetical protein
LPGRLSLPPFYLRLLSANFSKVLKCEERPFEPGDETSSTYATDKVLGVDHRFHRRETFEQSSDDTLRLVDDRSEPSCFAVSRHLGVNEFDAVLLAASAAILSILSTIESCCIVLKPK